MDIERRSAQIAALLAVTAAAIFALAMIAAAPARAEDVFRFNNNTGEGFTAFRNSLPECWSGETGVLAGSEEPLQEGTIHAEVGPFEGCEEFWGANLSYDQTFWESYPANNGETVYLWKGGVGAFDFFAEDPVVGPATLGCGAAGSEWAAQGGAIPIENEMSSEVDGTTCTVEWLPGAGPSTDSLDHATPMEPVGAKYSRFVDSLAPVKAGAAEVRVQTFGLHRLEVEDRIVLHTLGGAPIGEATTHLRVGDKAKLVAVPLAPAALKAIAHHGYLTVKASLTHIDGSKGNGDSTSQLVLKPGTPMRRSVGGGHTPS